MFIRKFVSGFKKIENNLKSLFNLESQIEKESFKQTILLGKILSNLNKDKKQVVGYKGIEFSVFSQFGDDGIIQYLINNLEISNKSFVEFGVGDYTESNTRFLLVNDNWSGLVMDCLEEDIKKIKSSDDYWRYDLKIQQAFITKDNINQLLQDNSIEKDLGLLHIDVDGNDFYIWEAINVINPIIVIMEYNSVFGLRPITIPYDNGFYRTKAHYSNLYWGASLSALNILAETKGYAFVGCNSAGNNAYFVRIDKLNINVTRKNFEEWYVESKYRESRDEGGNLTFLSGKERLNLLNNMPVYNVKTKRLENI